MITEILSTAGNRLLELDPETAGKLSALRGRAFKLEITVVEQSLFLIPTETGLRLEREWAGPVDVTLRGSPLAFARFGLKRRGINSDAFASRRLTIEGDAELAQDLQKAIAGIDLDFEELLSQYLGDVPAHQLGRGARTLLRWTREAAESLRLDIREYMVEESRVLAPAWRVDEFVERTDALRADVERLEARVRRLVESIDAA